MTILPKKKVEEESDSDGDNSTGGPDESSPHGAAGHDPLASPNTPEEVGYHSPDGFYHRCVVLCTRIRSGPTQICILVPVDIS